MFTPLFVLALLVAMFFIAGYFIWSQISKFFKDEQPSDLGLHANSVIR